LRTMVIIHFKKSEMNQFRCEVASKILVDELIDTLCYINNLRIKIEKLASGIEGLADYGPFKPEALRGLTMPETIEPAIETLPADQKKWANVMPDMSQRENKDPTGYRIGVAPMEEIAAKMKEICTAAKNIISKNKAKDKQNLVIKEMEEQMNLLRGVVMIAYPAYHGLPNWDIAYLILEDKMDFQSTWPDCDWLVPSDSSAWFCGRELYRGKSIAEQVAGGSNEKNTLIIKIEKKGAGAPVKESPIDEKLQKDMMAFYYKRQEELKKIEGESDDNFSNSTWANSNALKGHLATGGRDIGFKYK